MRDEIESRLAELKREFEFGQRQHVELEQTLIRISGAIQVLEELLAPAIESTNEAAPTEKPVAA